MKSFKQFLFESKAESYVNQWMKVHADHPLVQSNPEEARNLIGHARGFAQHPDEHHYLTRQLLDRTYKPEEDDLTIRTTLGKIRRARNRGIDIGDVRTHTHDTISDAFSKHFGLDLSQKQSRGMSGLERYHIGKIQHPEHGELDVHHIYKNDIEDDAEYENISSNLRKTCSGSSWCVLPKESGATHLKHYAHGHGIFFYSKNGVPVLSHGFGDRGIVRPDNSVIQTSEVENIKNQTSGLLSGKKKEVYDFFNGKDQKPTLEQQHRMYDEFGDKHGAAQFADPKMDTHPEILSKLLSHERYRVREAAVSHPNATHEHIMKGLEDSDYSVRRSAVSHPNATHEHIMKGLEDSFRDVREAAVLHPNATHEHIIKGLEDSDHGVRRSAVSHPNATHEHIMKGLEDYNPNVRLTAVSHPNATHEHIMKGLEDSDYSVREAAVSHPNATHEHIMKGLEDSDIFVRLTAVSHPNATHEHIMKGLEDSNSSIRNNAVSHPNATHEHIMKGLEDSDYSVRRSAVSHPNATHEHIMKGLEDSNEGVRYDAERQRNRLQELQSKENKVTESLNHTIIKILSQK